METAAHLAAVINITKRATMAPPTSMLSDNINADVVDIDAVISNNCTISSCNDSRDDYYIDSIHDYVFPQTPEWILIAINAMVLVIGLLGNFLVCYVVYRNISMQNVTNIFIVNLAVADFCVLLICLPPTVVWDVTETWFFGTIMCKLTLYFQTVSVSVSVLTLAALSVDRWYAVCRPLQCQATPRRAKTYTLIIWMIALLIGGYH
ncbi:orexin receptor type 2-like [Hyalella azteca]|uniref:Orexin receptor type 2-like n=2 Tax=Hyalella azteca TaxID=294128 RepID=A0A979FW13_HYAAZ|nr:orexin receptor type 2-like [Hyalella azteca]